MKYSCRYFLIVLLGALSLAGCNIPADPEHTLEKVRGGQMRIGVIDNPPWVTGEAGTQTVGGLEAQLMQDFARQLDAEIEWVRGPEAELMTALEHFQLDAVIGGLTDRSPWKKNISLSRPYHSSTIKVLPGVEPHKQRHVIALPPGENAWLLAMDRFLHARESDIPALLDRFAREPSQQTAAP